MRTLLGVLLVCAVVAGSAPTGWAAEPDEVKGTIPSVMLAKMGMAGMESLSDEAGMAIRGRGFPWAWKKKSSPKHGTSLHITQIATINNKPRTGDANGGDGGVSDASGDGGAGGAGGIGNVASTGDANSPGGAGGNNLGLSGSAEGGPGGTTSINYKPDNQIQQVIVFGDVNATIFQSQ